MHSGGTRTQCVTTTIRIETGPVNARHTSPIAGKLHPHSLLPHRCLEGGKDTPSCGRHLQAQTCGPKVPRHSAVHENDATQRDARTDGQLLCMRSELRNIPAICTCARPVHPFGRG